MYVAQPKYSKDFVVIFINVLSKNLVTFISYITITVKLTISITTALCSAKETSCSITASFRYLLHTLVAKIIGAMENRNKNSICLLPSMMPAKNKLYRKNPPLITVISQFISNL